MPKFLQYSTDHLDRALVNIRDSVYTTVAPLEITAWCTPEPMPFAKRRSGTKHRFAIGDSWGKLFDCAWFNFKGRVPACAAGKKVVLLIDLNGEACIVDRSGVPLRGLTNKSSDFWRPLGEPGKRVFEVAPRARGGERIDVWADAGCNDLFGNVHNNAAISEASIATCDDEMRALHYDFETLLDYCRSTPADTARHQQILAALDAVAMLAGDQAPVDAAAARRILAPVLAKRGGDPSLVISAVGHAHIDLGWLWPIRETKRKGARTFATVIDLMNRYPDYVFGASQPQLFAWMKQEYPELYAKIRRRVKEGRFEPQGAMWVEADANCSGGEALVRQILHGKRFFRKEFGVDIRHLWLPDAFGYNAALPQILRKSGVEYFMTQKMSWNRINVIPHHSFKWMGIDGSTVLTHMLPENNYNSPALPRAVAFIEKNYKDKDVSGQALMLFGIGDGGGGPGEEHLERLARLRDFAGLPQVKQETAAQFFDSWAKDAHRFQTWVGELYLEYHQGTFTTEARNKWFNRKMEQALRELEWTSVLAGALAGAAYPSQRLQAIWQETLLYQFHDILPGSSIKRVYDESLPRYRAMLDEVTDLVKRNDAAIARTVGTAGMRKPVLVQNSLSWARTEWVHAGGKWIRATVPPMGCKAVDAAAAGEPIPAVIATRTSLENDILRVRFGADGATASVYDKQAGREVLAAGAKANRLAVYRDTGNAWDFSFNYAEQRPRYMKLASATPHVDGPRAVMSHVYRIGHSELVQDVILTAGSRRLDFVTRLRWREIATMLRTSFPVAVHADNATFEIQYGHVSRPAHRNTSWDLAKDEVPAQKWADLSQRDYGVAVLNDSKYGCKVKDGVLDLNLLRSVPYPGPRLVKDEDVRPGEPHDGYTDQADHLFSYALYPHVGDHVEGRVVQAGYEFNIPLRAIPVQPRKAAGAAEMSFLQVDAPNIIVEAVKKAEDDSAIIVRLYEAAGAGTKATVRFGLNIKSAHETDLMEESPKPLKLARNSVTLAFRPFEIRTIKLVMG